MKAYVLEAVNKLVYKEVETPKCKSGYALVEIKAASICGSDIPRIFETGTYHFPTIPGHEFAGIVREVADEEYKDLVGERVGVFPLIPCRECMPCREGTYELCRNYNYLGSRCDGGFAEYVLVPIWNLLPLPEEVSFEEGAMLEPICVARHALGQLPKVQGKTVCIFGPGTIGLLMAQWLRIMGASEVLLVGTKKEQAELAAKLGMNKFCNVKTQNVEEFIQKNTKDQGVDIAIEGVGNSETLAHCLQVVKPGGDLLIVANPHGDVQIEKAVFWQILRKQLKIYGTWNSSYHGAMDSDWTEALKALESGDLKASQQITHKLPFDELHKGLRIMKERKEFYNKVMIIR